MADEPGGVTRNEELQAVIDGLDVDAVGVVRVEDWQDTRLGEAALKLLPGARSVVVMAMEVYPEILDLSSPGKVMGEASLNDLMDGNTDFINGRLTKAAYDVAKASRSLGFKALPLSARGCPLDSRFMEAAFSFKHAAQAAGLGRIGWNSLLITPDLGPRLRLSCCLTEAELEPTKSNITAACNGCRLCVENCPAAALEVPQAGEPYVINKFACHSFYSAAGGCAECVRVCPIGR